jgi:hypothetical protein
MWALASGQQSERHGPSISGGESLHFSTYAATASPMVGVGMGGGDGGGCHCLTTNISQKGLAEGQVACLKGLRTGQAEGARAGGGWGGVGWGGGGWGGVEWWWWWGGGGGRTHIQLGFCGCEDSYLHVSAVRVGFPPHMLHRLFSVRL